MKMKIVQLEGQSERSLSAKKSFERYVDVSLIQIGTLEGLLSELENGDVDLLLCSPSDITDGTLTLLNEHAPRMPIVLLSSNEKPQLIVRDTNPGIWDIISSSEMDRLPLSATRAVQSARERNSLRDELTQARELLVTCQKSIAVGRLLGSIAHEINNPLEAISNLLYLGQRNLSDEESTRGCFRMAEEQLQHVGEITKQMLQFHRESKTVQEVLLSDVMEGILVLYQNRLDMRSIRVVRQYRSSQRFLAHPGELRQAFSNLIANAIDAMPTGGQLLIRIREGRKCKLAVTVADRGHGISREAIRRLGELLFTTKGEAGTGLGLWVTYQLIAKYGGSVQVYSSTRPASHGTVFRVCFADSHRIVPEPEQSSSIRMERRAQQRTARRQDEEASDQDIRRA